MSPHHPSPAELAQFSEGGLPPSVRQDIETHLDNCRECQNKLLDAPDDWLVQRLRSPVFRKAFVPDEECSRIIAHLNSLKIRPNNDTHAPPEEFSAGTRIDQYDLLSRLGRGGMGAVYKVRHVPNGKLYALKLPRQAFHAEGATRFKQEMRWGEKLSSKHITKVINNGTFDGRLYFVMEYVEGVDLGRISQLVEQMPVDIACEIARQVALGIAHLQQNDLVHRDIKPSNLILSRDGYVKLLDFGLARPQILADERITQTGQVIGTIDYMAPEQAQGAKELDTRTDLYSLGATLYKLLTSKTPLGSLEDDNPATKLAALVTTDPAFIRDIRGDIPPALAELIHRLLSKAREQRPSEASEVVTALEEFAGGVELSRFAARTYQRSQELAMNGEKELPPRHSASGKNFSSASVKNARIAALCIASLFLVVLLFGISQWFRSSYSSKFASANEVLRFDKDPSDAELKSLGNLPLLKSVDFGDRVLSNTSLALKAVSTLPALTHLRMNALGVKGEDFYALAECRQLEELVLIDAVPIKDNDLWFLRNMNKLRRLELPASSVSGEGLKYLHPDVRLQVLNLNLTLLANDGWTQLPTLQALKDLDVGKTEVWDELLAFPRFVDLKRLNLEQRDLIMSDPGSSQISDKVIDAIASLSQLESLELRNARMRDEQILPLKRLRNLRYFDNRGTDVSRTATEVLKKELPNCTMPKLQTTEP